MERPTSALHLTRVTLDLRGLNAEPHTKEVGHGRVYYHRGVRSARGNDGGGGAAAGAPDASSAPDDVGPAGAAAVRAASAAPGRRAVLLRSGPVWVRAAAGPPGRRGAG